MFAVPSCVVDEHIKLAGASSLKVLLYILRNSGAEIDSDELSLKLSLSKEDVADALGYWITCGVLSRKGENITPAEGIKEEKNTVSEEPKAEKPALPKKQKKERISYNFDECADIIAKDDAIAEMLLAVEACLSKQLTHREVSLYVTLTHWYGFNPKLVPMLLHYCRVSGTMSSSYIESTGIGWIEEGIDTIEKAENKVKGKTGARAAWRKISSLLEIDRQKPSEKEETFSNVWVNEWGMPSELILEAYERCVNKKGKLSFTYMNGILQNWQTEGIASKEKLAEYEARSKSEKKNKNASGRFEPTYDKNEIEQMLWDEMLDDITED